MAYSAKVGSFNIDSTITAGNDQAVTGVGFQPKIVLFWWSGSTATGDTVAGGTIRPGFGAAVSSSSRFSVYGYSADAAATADSNSGQDDDNCIKTIASGTTTEGEADFKSMDADGFTLTIDNQFDRNYRISYLALGGDDLTNVFISNFRTPTGTGNHNITGVGFQPDALILAGVALDSADTTAQYLDFEVGWATGSSNQGTVYISSYDEVGTSNTWSYGYNGEALATLEDTGMKVREAFVSFGADGFTLNQLETSNRKYFFYICLKGGQYSVGDLTTRTDGNDISENVGFQPAAVMFASVNRALSTQDTPTAHARMSIGAGTSTSNRAVHAVSDEDNLSDTETAYGNYDSAVYAHVADDAIVALMDIKSIDASGFTCTMDDTEAAAAWVTYLAIGAVAASADELTAKDIASAVPTVEEPTIGQKHAMTALDVVSAVPVVEEAAIGQTHALTALDIASATPAIEEANVGQVYALTALDVTGAVPTVEEPVIGQTHALTSLDAAFGVPVVEEATIGQTHALTALDVVAGVAVVEEATVGQAHALTALDIASATPAIEETTIGQVHALTALDAASGVPVVEEASIGQTHTLTALDIASAAPVVEEATVGQTHTLTALDIASAAPVVEEATVGQTHALTALDIASATPAIEEATIGQTHALTALDVVSAVPVVEEATLSEATHLLTAQDVASGVPTVEKATIGQTHALIAGIIATDAPSIEQPSIGQVHALVSQALMSSAPVVEAAVVRQANAFVSQDVTFGIPVIQKATLLLLGNLIALDIASGVPSVDKPVIGQMNALTALDIASGVPVIERGIMSTDLIIADVTMAFALRSVTPSLAQNSVAAYMTFRSITTE